MGTNRLTESLQLTLQVLFKSTHTEIFCIFRIFDTFILISEWKPSLKRYQIYFYSWNSYFAVRACVRLKPMLGILSLLLMVFFFNLAQRYVAKFWGKLCFTLKWTKWDKNGVFCSVWKIMSLVFPGTNSKWKIIIFILQQILYSTKFCFSAYGPNALGLLDCMIL